ncbi:MAG: VCBS repeat-containing protein, partial [Bacteroidota bacterium]
QIGWIENQGPNSWGTLEVLNTLVNGAQTIDLADIDQDGDNDIIAAGEYDDDWTYHINNGGETALGDFTIGEGDNVSSITVADINGDAFPDAFAVYGIDGDVVWAAGNGNGFDDPEFILDGNGFPDNFPITVEANDLDQDGLVDAVVCSILSDEVIWFRNLGGGSFGPQQIIGTGASNVRQTAVDDFDGDGDLDVAAALFGSSTLVWYEDTSPQIILGCTNIEACNYDSNATQDDGNCDFSCVGCTDPLACNFAPEATINDGCDYECYGCTLSIACNYDETATIDDNSCEFTSCSGCQDVNACDYDSNALYPSSCDYSCYGCTDQGACNYDVSATIDNGLCNFNCFGCTDPSACNYNIEATQDDGSCTFSSNSGCTDDQALNYEPEALIDDGSCLFTDNLCGSGTFWDEDLGSCIGTGVEPNTCPGDFNEDNLVNTQDLLEFLIYFGSQCN